MMDGRDAAPGPACQHPGAPRSSGRPGGPRGTASPSRSRRRQPYPFVKAASIRTPFEGSSRNRHRGPSMVRAAAKNFRGVLIVVDPDYSSAVRADQTPSLAFRFALRRSTIQACDTPSWNAERDFGPVGRSSGRQTPITYSAIGSPVVRQGSHPAPGRIRIKLRRGTGRAPGGRINRRALALRASCGGRSFRTNLLDLDTAAQWS